MSREFLGWHWITDAGKRGAIFSDPEIGKYICHYIDELPCSRCVESVKIKKHVCCIYCHNAKQTGFFVKDGKCCCAYKPEEK